MRTYKDKIEELLPNQVFVFGSNPLGINGNPEKGTGGAALFALNKGWIEQGEKLNNCLSNSGKAFGITTVAYPGGKKSKTPKEIETGIRILYSQADYDREMDYLIAYTGLYNYNLNGYTNLELSKMFYSPYIPENIIFEEQFGSLVKSYKSL